MRKSYVGIKCSFCVTPIQEDEEIIICTDCKKPHHLLCWMYNLDRCTTFGCKGKSIDPRFLIENLDSYSFGQRKTDVNTSYKKPEENLPKIPPKPVKVKFEPLAQTKKPQNSLQERNQRIQKTKRTTLPTLPETPKILDDRNTIPKPAPYIPGYVNATLDEYKSFLEKGKKKKRNPVIPPVEIPQNKKGESEKNPVPKAEPFVPSYVDASLEEYKKFLVKEKPKRKAYVPLPKGFLEEFYHSKEPQKSNIPKPEPFIPEYVNEELKALPPKKRNSKFRNLQNTIRPVTIPHKKVINYESDVPRPEPYIPDYVNSELLELPKIFLPDELIKSKLCPFCQIRIKASLTKCPNCKKNIDGISQKTTQNITEIKVPETEERTPEILFPASNVACRILSVDAKNIRGINFTPDGNKIVFSGQDKILKIWDLQEGKPVKNLEGHTKWITSVAISTDGKFIATGSADTLIKIWDFDTGECIKTITGHNILVDLLTFSPDGNFLVSGGGYGIIKIWDVNSKRCFRTIADDSKWVNSISVNFDNTLIATGNSDFLVLVMRLKTGEFTKEFKGHLDFVNSVAFSPDGKYVVSGSSDKTLKVWDMLTDSCLITINGHNDDINTIAFSPSGRFVASGSDDKTIRVWDVVTGKCVKNLIGHTQPVYSISFSPDGKYIASGGNDKTIRIWTLW